MSDLTKAQLVEQANELAQAAGDKLDVSKLPHKRLPTTRDRKVEIEAVIGTLSAMGECSDPIREGLEAARKERPPVTTEHDEAAENQRRQRARRKALACGRALIDKAPDKLPEKIPRNRARFERLVNSLAADDVPALETFANSLKKLADQFAPRPCLEDVQYIEERLDELQGKFTFPDDLKEATQQFMNVSNPEKRHQALLNLDPTTATKIADVLDRARKREIVSDAVSAAEGLGKGSPVVRQQQDANRANSETANLPTFPADPEEVVNDSNPALAPPASPGTIQGESDVEETQVRKIVNEAVGPINGRLAGLEQKFQHVTPDKMTALLALTDKSPATEEALRQTEADLRQQLARTEKLGQEEQRRLSDDKERLENEKKRLENELAKRPAAVVESPETQRLREENVRLRMSRAPSKTGELFIFVVGVLAIGILLFAAFTTINSGYLGNYGTRTKPVQQQSEPAEVEPIYDFSDV